MMPDLPNVGWERDIESFREFFDNPDFRCVLTATLYESITSAAHTSVSFTGSWGVSVSSIVQGGWLEDIPNAGY